MAQRRRSIAVVVAAISLASCNSDSADTTASYGSLESPLTSNGVTATLVVSSSWDAGYCVNVTLNNSTSVAVTSWSLGINLNGTTVNNLWSANYTTSGGNISVTPAAQNANIPVNASTSFGFCGTASNGNRPALSTLTVVGSTNGGTGGGSAGGTSSQGGSSARGGTASTGGASSKGGTTSTGGTSTTAVFQCKNLLSAAGSTGKPKPSGAVGGLKVLDWAGFTGAVSFTFDDGNMSQISNYSKLTATGARMTFFLVTGWSNASNAIWKTAVTNGHEIGNHTKSHSSTAALSDLQAAEDFIKSTFGVTAYSMAAPNGASSWTSVAPNLMLLNRGVSNGLIGPRDSSNQYNLPAYIPPTGASASTMTNEVNAAKTSGKWKIFVVHGFTGDASAYQPLDVNAMTTTMSNAVKNGLWADTLSNVGAYWLGQKLVPSSATTSASWTLPARFPPNMCLRVTTTGGTVKQNGAIVPWNDHGYYEISLDAKSVSVQ